jgi:hypothetical protein
MKDKEREIEHLLGQARQFARQAGRYDITVLIIRSINSVRAVRPVPEVKPINLTTRRKPTPRAWTCMTSTKRTTQ